MTTEQCRLATIVTDGANASGRIGKFLVESERVIEMERITRVSRHELRPDLTRIFGGR